MPLRDIRQDKKNVKVSTTDSVPAFLNDKITVASGLVKAITNTGGDEKLELSVALEEDPVDFFPSDNVVFVDANAAVLMANGRLAYTTVAEAMVSWRSGGAAATLYGTPSPSNPCAILMGFGTFTETATITCDVPHLTITGLTGDTGLHEITCSLASAPLFDVTVDFVHFANLRLSNTNNADSSVFRLNSNRANCTFNHLDISSSGGAFAVKKFIHNTAGGISGYFRHIRGEIGSDHWIGIDIAGTSDFVMQDCEFKMDASVPANLIGNDGPHSVNAVLRRIRMFGTQPSASPGGLINSNNGHFGGLIEDCLFEVSNFAFLINSGGGIIAGRIRRVSG